MLNRKQIRDMVCAVTLLVICGAAAGFASSSRKKQPPPLIGQFVARVDGPRLTDFGFNQQFYVFELVPPGSESQFVLVLDKFLIYQSHVPYRVLDDSKLYQLAATRDQGCDNTLENLSSRFVFDSYGVFLGMKNALSYANNLAAPALPWKTSLPCYVVTPPHPGASVVREANRAAN
jgi:hypothetical protein